MIALLNWSAELLTKLLANDAFPLNERFSLNSSRKLVFAFIKAKLLLVEHIEIIEDFIKKEKTKCIKYTRNTY